MSQTNTKKYRYPGVTPFKTEQANIFFGRKQDTEELYRLIRREPLVVLYGKSGLGKSSLINAGIIPECEKDKIYTPIVIRFGAWTENADSTPLSVLKTSLNIYSKQTILDKLIPKDESLWRCAKNRQLNKGGKPLILFDQFEELFSYPEAQITTFQQELSELLNTGIPLRFRRLLDNISEINDDDEEALESPLEARIVFAIRSDRMHLLDRLTTYLPNLLRNCFELKALKWEDARSAILLPAKEIGDFTTKPFTYSERAIQELLTFLEDGQEKRVEGILLQMLCEYYERKEVDGLGKQLLDVNDIGDPNEVVKNYYEEKLEALPLNERNAARLLIEEGLVSEGEEMRLTLHEAYIVQEYNVGKELLEKLVDSRLLRSEPFMRGGYTYELCHDRLVNAVINAKKNRLEEEQKEKLIEEQERKQRIDEEERNREEERRLFEIERKGKRQARILALIASSFGILAIAASVFATKSMIKAQKQIMIAEEARRETIEALSEADKQRQQAEIAGEFANLERSKAEDAYINTIKALKAVKMQKFIADSLRMEAFKQLKITERSKAEAEKQRNMAFQSERMAKIALLELKKQLEENKKLQEKNQQYEDLLKQLRPNRYKQIGN